MLACSTSLPNSSMTVMRRLVVQGGQNASTGGMGRRAYRVRQFAGVHKGLHRPFSYVLAGCRVADVEQVQAGPVAMFGHKARRPSTVEANAMAA